MKITLRTYNTTQFAFKRIAIQIYLFYQEQYLFEVEFVNKSNWICLVL